MRTTDLFKNNRSSKRLNESLSKTFGTKLDLESFDTPKLEDARNKLRTQIHTARQESGFNETIENETLTQAQFMHDAIVAELMDRQEHIVDASVQEGNDEVASVLGRIADEEDFDQLYDLFGDRGPVGEYLQDQIADITMETGLHPKDDFERIEGMIMDRIQQEFGGQNDDEGGETDDNYALASAGFGSDEDYESIETEDASSRMSMAQELYKSNPDLDSEDDILNAGFAIMKQRDGAKAARYYFSYDEDFPSDFISEYKWLQRQEHDVGEGAVVETYSYEEIAQKVYDENPDLPTSGRGDEFFSAAWPYVVELAGGSKKRANYYMNYDEDFPSDLISAYADLQRQAKGVGEATGRDAYQRDYDASVSGMGSRERENDEGNTEPANNFAVSINGKQWKVFKGRGQYADDSAERNHYQQLKAWAAKKSESTGKKWTVSITGENPTESIDQKEDMNTNEAYINNARDAINLLADIRKQSKMAELGQGDPVRPNQLVNDLYDVMQWIEANMKESVNTESVNTGDIMTRLQEGEVQQASAIVTAKTMVDRISRWIEELSSMENDTLLQLGDSIRDEMGQEQAKAFISSVAPAIQQALENLKSTRETMATGVRQLTGEEQGAEMLGGEPAGMGGDEMGPAEPDAMNMGGEDEFAAAEPAAGGLGDAGREQRESINRSSSLLKVLAG
jgi:hypothetical protein